jgi:hypothetical protein
LVGTTGAGQKDLNLKGQRILARENWRWKTESMENYSQSFAKLCIVSELAGVGPFPLDRQNIDLEFYYPVVVFQGPIYEVRVRGTELDLKESDYLQLRHSASVGGRVVPSQIDVVSERGLPALIDLILSELTKTVAGIKVHEERLMGSAIDQKRVATQRRGAGSIGLRGNALY